MGNVSVFHEHISPIPSTAPPNTLTRRRDVRAAWRTTTSSPRYSTLPSRPTFSVVATFVRRGAPRPRPHATRRRRHARPPPPMPRSYGVAPPFDCRATTRARSSASGTYCVGCPGSHAKSAGAHERERSRTRGRTQRFRTSASDAVVPPRRRAGDVMRWLATGQLGGAAKQKWLPPAQRGHRNSGLN